MRGSKGHIRLSVEPHMEVTVANLTFVVSTTFPSSVIHKLQATVPNKKTHVCIRAIEENDKLQVY